MGLPNGYILGEEAGGAFIGGLRYGDGKLYTKNAGDMRVYWQGPTLGSDAGADGDRTMMLVYNMPRTEAIFERFGGVDGSAYLVGGFGMTALTTNDIRSRTDPLGRRVPPRCQSRLSQIHAEPHLESLLIPVISQDHHRRGRLGHTRLPPTRNTVRASILATCEAFATFYGACKIGGTTSKILVETQWDIRAKWDKISY